MDNFVSMNYSYHSVRRNTSEKVMYVFERLMEIVDESRGIEVDNLYHSPDFTRALGFNIPAPTLTALVNRGMLYCDGKVNGRNAYAITEEIYDYYKNTYKPGLNKYEKHMNKYLAVSVEGN